MFRFLIRFLRANGTRPAHNPSARPVRPSLEVLDARTLPSTFAVGAVSDPPVVELSHVPAHVTPFGGMAGGVIAHSDHSFTSIWVGQFGGVPGGVVSNGSPAHVEVSVMRSIGEEIPQ